MERGATAERETPRALFAPGGAGAPHRPARDATLTGQRLVALFLLGALLFNYPLFALFASSLELAGIPLLHVYVFVAWALLIALMALVIERRSD
jgi:hypothetical protein